MLDGGDNTIVAGGTAVKLEFPLPYSQIKVIVNEVNVFGRDFIIISYFLTETPELFMYSVETAKKLWLISAIFEFNLFLFCRDVLQKRLYVFLDKCLPNIMTGVLIFSTGIAQTKKSFMFYFSGKNWEREKK